MIEKTKGQFVRNYTGSTNAKSPNGLSWLEYWEAKTRAKAVSCSCNDCYEPANAGTHVFLTNDLSQKAYIIPLCKEHSQASNIAQMLVYADFIKA